MPRIRGAQKFPSKPLKQMRPVPLKGWASSQTKEANMFFNRKKKERQSCEEAVKAYGLQNCGWCGRFPERTVLEVHKLVNNTSAQISSKKDTLIIKERLTNNFGTSFLMRIEAKDFPFKMPKAFIESPRIKARAGKHFYKDGSICLFHPQEWNSRYSLLKVRNHVAAFCFCLTAYQKTGLWPASEKWHLF